MDETRIVRALKGNDVAEDLRGFLPSSKQAVNEVRSLDDWELVLVSGGEAIPCWP